MLGGDVVPGIVLIDSGVVRIRILVAWMLGFATFWVSVLCLSVGIQAGNSRHDGCCGTSGYIGLFHMIALAKASCTPAKMNSPH